MIPKLHSLKDKIYGTSLQSAPKGLKKKMGAAVRQVKRAITKKKDKK